MAELNKVLLIGRLTQDPKLRYTPSGTPVTDLRLAVNRTFRDQSGGRREESCFLDVVVWSKQAETCCEYLAKGRQVLVEGRLSMDSWQTPDGQKRSRLRVVAERCQFMDSRGGRGGAPESDFGRTYANDEPRPPEAGADLGSAQDASPVADEIPEEDDVPF
jgi:single-strand DNA-binding protein